MTEVIVERPGFVVEKPGHPNLQELTNLCQGPQRVSDKRYVGAEVGDIMLFYLEIFDHARFDLRFHRLRHHHGFSW